MTETTRHRLTNGQLVALLIGRAEGLGMRGDAFRRDGQPMNAARCYIELRRTLTAACQCFAPGSDLAAPATLQFEMRDPLVSPPVMPGDAGYDDLWAPPRLPDEEAS